MTKLDVSRKIYSIHKSKEIDNETPIVNIDPNGIGYLRYAVGRMRTSRH
jgi:hypothetical protein